MENIFTIMIFIAAVIYGFESHAAGTWQEADSARLIKQDEVEHLRAASVKGDAESSYKLSLFYGHHESYSFIDYFFYLRLAAEQGSCKAVFDFHSLQNQGSLSPDFFIKGWRGSKKMFYVRAAQEAFPGQNSKKASGIIPDFYDQRVKSLFPDQGFPK